MAQGNEDVAKFYCTKHSWRGKYKRVFSIGTKAITTYNPNTHEVTNQWCYNEFVGIAPSPKASNEFIITMKKGMLHHFISTSLVLPTLLFNYPLIHASCTMES
ncbi:DnaJ homolog subfamily C member 13, partial [Geodia barretti]